ncbi:MULTISPECIES: hypothetical protein [Slackia]|uniref:hypothetical protein n=1 Tax=Slackia TaxID=84108 RepID=UPI000303645B|nr:MULTISPECIES: hypothetical protein [Slackia]
MDDTAAVHDIITEDALETEKRLHPCKKRGNAHDRHGMFTKRHPYLREKSVASWESRPSDSIVRHRPHFLSS